MNREYWITKIKEIRHYNRQARNYVRLYGDEQDHKKDSLLNTVEIAENDIILDLGCGPGFLLNSLCNSVDLVVGIDISRNMLELAYKKTRHVCQGSKVALVMCDADFLPFRRSIFDKVFALTLFQNMPNPMITFREIKRASKMSATIAITFLKKAYDLNKIRNFLLETELEWVIIDEGQKSSDYYALYYQKK